MSGVKRMRNNAVWLTAAEILSKVIAFFSVVWITQYLTKEGFGQYSFVTSFGMIFAVIANFGFGAYVTREISKYKDKAQKIFSNLLTFKVAVSTFTILLIAGISLFIDKSPEVIYGLLIISLFIVFDAFRGFIDSVYKAYEKMGYAAFNRVGERVLYLLLLWLVVHFDLGIVWLFVALASSSLFFTFVQAVVVHRRFLKIRFAFDKKYIKSAFKQTFYFVLNDIFIVVFFKVDVIMLSFLKGDALTATYNAVYSLIYALVFIPTVLSNVLYPVLSRFYVESKEKFIDSIPIVIKYFFLSVIPVLFGLLVFSEDILEIVYRGKFDDGLMVFYVLSFVLVFVFMNYILSTLLNTVDKQKIVAIGSSFAMVLNIVLNYFLIPQYDIVGAGVATLATEGLFCALLLVLVVRHISFLKIAHVIKTIGLFISIGLSVGFFYLFDYNNYILFIVSMIVFAVLLFVFRVIGKRDIMYIKKSIL